LHLNSGREKTSKFYTKNISIKSYKHLNLKVEINKICTSVTPEILFRIRQNFVRKINKCLDVNEHQFKHLIKKRTKL